MYHNVHLYFFQKEQKIDAQTSVITEGGLPVVNGWFSLNGNRPSGPKVISHEVMPPLTRVVLPEICSHVTQNIIKCINLKKTNILSIPQGLK